MPEALSPQTPLNDLPEYLTVREVAAYLRLARNVVYDAVHSGQLPSRRFAGRQFRIPRSALSLWASAATPERVDGAA